MKFYNQFCLRCPKCRKTNAVDIAAVVWVRLTADGSDADISENGDHEWNIESDACCGLCTFNGIVADFRTFQCANCRRIWNRDKLIGEIAHYTERVAPDEEEPDGECPECGALCYQLEDPAEIEVK